MECAAPLNRQDETDFICSNGHYFWNNPKGTASVLFVREAGQGHEVLIGKRAIDPFKGKYDIPGGFINFGENPYDGARREMREETGVEPDKLHLLHVGGNLYGDSGISTTDIFFICTEWEGTFKPDDDVASLEWKPLDFLRMQDELAWFIPGLADQASDYLSRQ